MNDLLLMQMRAQLSRDEGRVRHLYRDSAGHPTIGIGFNLDAIGMPDAVMDLWLETLLQDIEAELWAALPVYQHLGPARQGCVLNMAYTMGVAGVKTFTHMLERLGAHDAPGAAAAIRASVWAVKEEPERAERVAKQMETDDWI